MATNAMDSTNSNSSSVSEDFNSDDSFSNDYGEMAT